MELNHKKKVINIIGLSFGLLGVILIFFYGPPQPSFFPFDIITDSNIHQEVLDMRDKYDLFSKIGLVFIFIGFLLQLIAVILSDHTNKKSVEKIEETKATLNANSKDSIKK